MPNNPRNVICKCEECIQRQYLDERGQLQPGWKFPRSSYLRHRQEIETKASTGNTDHGASTSDSNAQQNIDHPTRHFGVELDVLQNHFEKRKEWNLIFVNSGIAPAPLFQYSFPLSSADTEDYFAVRVEDSRNLEFLRIEGRLRAFWETVERNLAQSPDDQHLVELKDKASQLALKLGKLKELEWNRKLLVSRYDTGILS